MGLEELQEEKTQKPTASSSCTDTLKGWKTDKREREPGSGVLVPAPPS
jgi:hypothetical protein